MSKQLQRRIPLSWLLPQAKIDKVYELGAPAVAFDRGDGIVDDTVHELVGLADMLEGWQTCGQLVAKAAERPYVNLFGVEGALGNLRRHPVRCPMLRRAPLLLLGEDAGVAQVTDLDLARV